MEVEWIVECIFDEIYLETKDYSSEYPIQKIVIAVNDKNIWNEELKQTIVLEQIWYNQVDDVKRIKLGEKYLFVLGSKAKEYLYDNWLKTVFWRIYMANCYPAESNSVESDIVVEWIVECIYPETYKKMEDWSELVIKKVLIVLTYWDWNWETLEKREIVLEQVWERQVNLIKDLKEWAKYDFTLKFKAHYGIDRSIKTINNQWFKSAFWRVYTTGFKLLEVDAEIPEFEIE